MDFTRGIKVKCVRIDDGREDIFPIWPYKSSVVSKMASRYITGVAVGRQPGFMLGNRTEEYHRE